MKQMCRTKQKQTHRHRLRVEPGVRQGFLCLATVITLSGTRSRSTLLAQKPWGADSIHFGCVLFLYPTTPCPRGEQCEQEGLAGVLHEASRHRPLQSDHHQKSKLSLMDDLCNRPWSWQHSLWCWSVCLAQAGPDTSLVSGTSHITHLVLTVISALLEQGSVHSPCKQSSGILWAIKHPRGPVFTLSDPTTICGSNSSLTREGLH